MALRNVLTDENPALRKVCRPYTEFNERLHQLLDDMRETMLEEDGVGLAAPRQIRHSKASAARYRSRSGQERRSL